MKLSIRLLFLLLLSGILTACQKQVSALLVLGGHAFDTTEFFETFRSLEGITFDTVSHPHALKLLASEQTHDYDLLVFYDFVPELAPVDSSIFLNLTRYGHPLLFLHHSICSFQQWDGYMQLVGGRYFMPGFGADTLMLSDYKHGLELSVSVLNRDHPVTRGIEDFNIHDEGYSNVRLLPGITPLLQTDHPDCSPIVGWVNSFDRSTIVYLMLGHDKLAYSNASFQQLLENSIHWLSTQNTRGE